MKKILSLLYLFLPIFLGGIIAFLIKDYIDYTSVVRPFLSPPKILFPIAWTLIYLFMGISYYLYKRENNEFGNIDFVYYIQLFINIFWSIIFFLWRFRFIAILWILLLDIFVIALIYLFWQRKRISAYLNFPYLLWILFATYLTIGIYILN